MSGVTCDTNFLTPEDVLKKIVRTDGAGNYALAVNDLSPIAGWELAAECQDGITWRDIVMMVYDQTKNAINIVDAT